VLYCLMSMAIQWPLVGAINSHISYGQEAEITVPLLNLWTVWWNSDRLWHGFQEYWNSPIFVPTEKTFVFSEAQPTSVIVAPLLWLSGNRGLAYNIYQLLILALNGYSAHRLFRRLGHIPWLAFCGGVMSQTLPFVIWQFGVVQLTTLFGIYWTIHAVLDLFGTAQRDPTDDWNILTGTVEIQMAVLTDTERFRDPSAEFGGWQSWMVGARLGLSYGLTYWLCNYWGLFLTLLLIHSSVCLWNRRLFAFSFWRAILLAGLIALVMIGPFAWVQKSLAKQHDWQIFRTEEMVYGLSARWQDHTDVPWQTWTSWLEFPETKRNTIWTLGGGGLKLLLVPFGFVAALMRPRRRRWGAFVLIFGLLAFGLSLGPTIQFAEGIPLIGQLNPYRLLQQYVPGFSLIRSPFRFAVFVQLVAVWLSLEALDLLNPLRWSRRSEADLEMPGASWSALWHAVINIRGSWRKLAIWIPLVATSAIVTLEVVPPVAPMYPLPSTAGLPVWVTWLRDSAEPNATVACLPFPLGNQVNDYEETAIWMYWGTFHGKSLLNGYSGFFPKTYNDLRDALGVFPQPNNLKDTEIFVPKFRDYAWNSPGLARLNESSAKYVVVKRAFGTRDDVLTHPQSRFRWALVVSDEMAQIDVYELPSQDE
jgi:hypothetical protein